MANSPPCATSPARNTSYDARGRVESSIKRIPDPLFLSTLNPHRSTVWSATAPASTYDSLDRSRTLTYPDNDQVTYLYNAAQSAHTASPAARRAISSATSFTAPSAQLASIDYGNGVRTTYDYDPRLRLNGLDDLARHRSPNSS